MRKWCWYWLFVACWANPLISDSHADAADQPASSAASGKTRSAPEVVEVREFEVRVDNKPAGNHQLTIKTSGTRQQVEFQTDVKLDFIVYAYVYKLRGTENWRDGKLEHSDIRSEDGGKKRALELKTDGAIQQISFNGKSIPSNLPSPCTMTTAYWRLPATDRRATPLPIVDVDTGATSQVSMTTVGPATVTCAGRTVACQHFKIDGPSPAELWFDDEQRMVRQKSIESGHSMELRLKRIQLPKTDR
jgi:hypothetical protein